MDLIYLDLNYCTALSMYVICFFFFLTFPRKCARVIMNDYIIAYTYVNINKQHYAANQPLASETMKKALIQPVKLSL